MKWNRNSAKDFVTDRPHICIWNFQMHTVIMQPNPFTVEEGLSQAFSLFCRLWSRTHSRTHPRVVQDAIWGWRINNPGDPHGLQAPPLWETAPPARPLGGRSQVCRSVGAPVSTVRGVVQAQGTAVQVRAFVLHSLLSGTFRKSHTEMQTLF